MKGIGLWLGFAFALLLAVFSPASTGAEAEIQRTLRLPLSLRIIADEAFTGSGAEAVYMPSGMETVGDLAFSEMPNLREVYIPPTVERLGREVFRGSGELTLYGLPGSPAEDWARQHHYKFVYRDIWSAAHAVVRGYERRSGGTWHRYFDAAAIAALLLLFRLLYTEERAFFRFRDRPEMYPLDYDFP